MSQMFQVLKCFKCYVFQVHQTKKSNKWECKLCGEKQSIKRHYGLGTGKECRLHVQRLNGVRGEIEELTLNKESDEELESEIINSTNTGQSSRCNIQRLESKWSGYVENEPTVKYNCETMYLDDAQVVLDKPTKYRKLGKSYNKNAVTKSVVSRCNEENISNTSNIQTSSTLQHIKSLNKSHRRDCEQFIVPMKNSSINEKDSSPHNDGLMILKENNNISFHESLNVTEDTKNTYCGNNTESDLPLLNSNSKVQIDKNISSTSVKYLPPKINKNSKWAQFTDVSDTPDEDNETESASSIDNNPPKIPTVKALFSLCDDCDLDSVLDI